MVLTYTELKRLKFLLDRVIKTNSSSMNYWESKIREGDNPEACKAYGKRIENWYEESEFALVLLAKVNEAISEVESNTNININIR
ncbi:MAG TPA: hypothetical protein GXZ90_09835 [Clostridiales bacterium]|nr:hypothetical protein [Clostridiales bacterium]